ncbi:MAG: hypothetical protein EXQ95_13770 [Alphaproteobacteria bacterium]|nr:hypothetical protein [Alphaproteobacteria bacterium]
MTSVPDPTQGQTIHIVALGWGLAGALVVLYALCALVLMIVPGLPLAHGWLGLFSTAPAGSVRSWAEGIVGSLAFGWVAAVVLGLIYNRVAGR